MSESEADTGTHERTLDENQSKYHAGLADRLMEIREHIVALKPTLIPMLKSDQVAAYNALDTDVMGLADELRAHAGIITPPRPVREAPPAPPGTPPAGQEAPPEGQTPPPAAEA